MFKECSDLPIVNRKFSVHAYGFHLQEGSTHIFSCIWAQKTINSTEVE